MEYQLLNLSTEIIFGAVLALIFIQNYKSYFRTNDVSKVDVAELYVQRQLDMRYRKNRGA